MILIGHLKLCFAINRYLSSGPKHLTSVFLWRPVWKHQCIRGLERADRGVETVGVLQAANR